MSKDKLLIPILLLIVGGLMFFERPLIVGAPPYRVERAIQPEANNSYWLGTSTKAWSDIFAYNLSASGTVTFLGLKSSSDCLVTNTSGVVATTTCGGSSFTSAATSTAGLVVSTSTNTITYGLRNSLADISGLAITDSNFIVGNGTTWVAESGSTARASLGLLGSATQIAFWQDANTPVGDANLTWSSSTATFAVTGTSTISNKLNIPNGTAPSITAQGELAIDTTDDQLVYRGATSTDRIVPYLHTASFVIDDPSSSDKAYDLWTAPYDFTISRIRCHTIASSTAINAELDYRTGVNAATSTIENAITCSYTGATDDGTFTDAAIARGQIVHINLNTASGTPSSLVMSVEFTVDRK